MPEKALLSEVVESLTGYEEEAIHKAFGHYVGDLETMTMIQRGALFILKRREGLDTAKAKDAAMSVTIKGLSDHFVDEDADDDPDLPPVLGKPETEAGKDDAQPDAEPASSPTGATPPASPPPSS